MNVGIFLGYMKEAKGGEYTFQESIVRALETVDTNHNIFAFYSGRMTGAVSTKKVTYVPLLENVRLAWIIKKGLSLLTRKPTNVLMMAAELYRIDMMWFPSLNFVPLDIPYICTVLDLEHRVHPFFPEVGAAETWKWRERLFTDMVPRAAYVITGTEAGKHQIIDFYHPDPERVRVVPFPVSPFALEEQDIPAAASERLTGGRPYLFYPAQFWPHKNHVALVHALKLLRERHALDLDVVFCGSDKGNVSHVRATARELGIESRVRFLGFVTKEELYALYRDAFALVYPSMFGPDNLPPLEAFAIGCPVVAARVAGAEEQLGDAALLVDPRSEEEMAAAVARLHAEHDFRRTLIERGRARAQRWTAHDYVRKVLSVYDEYESYRRCWSRVEKYVHP